MRFQMNLQPRIGDKHFAARSTLKRLLSGMRLLVPLQVHLDWKSLVALGAEEFVVFAVQLFMCRARHFRRELFVAQTTLQGSFGVVRPHVSIIRLAASQRFTAHFALEKVLSSCVESIRVHTVHVILQRRFTGVRLLVTKLALELSLGWQPCFGDGSIRRWLPRVHSLQMLFQFCYIETGFRTILTTQLFSLPMYFHMYSQCILALERLVTKFTHKVLGFREEALVFHEIALLREAFPTNGTDPVSFPSVYFRMPHQHTVS